MSRRSIFLIYLFIFIVGICASCGKEDEISKPDQEQIIKNDQYSKERFFDQNVAFADARVRSVSRKKYIREIVLVNFSEFNKMPASVIFDGTTFFDDGSFNDLTAYDGIYTSAAIFNHSERVPYYEDLTLRSVMEETIIDYKFKHRSKLDKITDTYVKPRSSSNGIYKLLVVTMECDIKYGTCGCRADEYGWCDCCCIRLTNCRISVSIVF